MWYEKDAKHSTPHFHARYGGDEASFTLSGEILAGKFPQRQAALVKAWALLHEEDLIADWELAISMQEPMKIEPLR
jgi:hypothetical protein